MSQFKFYSKHKKCTINYYCMITLKELRKMNCTEFSVAIINS